MNRLEGWRRPLAAGLVCLAAAAAFAVVMVGLDDDDRRGGPRAPAAEAGTAATPVGPAMELDPGELARAGRGRDDNGLRMPFCWCPPGRFHLGARPAGPAAVRLRRGYWMGKYEVTQDQWLRLIGLTLHEQRAKDPDQPRPVGDGTTRAHVGEGPDHPIYFVSHAEAEAFARRFTEAERSAGRLGPGWEYRLPTEAQWEFACRAGTTTATAFGDRLGSDRANFDGTQPYHGAPEGPYLRETTPVGRYPANAWGLHDMHGNVWEWCRDGFAPTPAGGDDPVGPTTASAARRAYRGGCWHNPGVLCLSTARTGGGVDDRGSGLGFRLALVPVVP